jgi:hypothetical protein
VTFNKQNLKSKIVEVFGSEPFDRDVDIFQLFFGHLKQWCTDDFKSSLLGLIYGKQAILHLDTQKSTEALSAFFAFWGFSMRVEGVVRRPFVQEWYISILSAIPIGF